MSIVIVIVIATLSSQGGGASAMLVFDVQMLLTGMMVWTGRTHVLAAPVQETTIRVYRATRFASSSLHSQVAQRRADPSRGEIDPSTYLKTRITLLSLAARVAFALPSPWSLCVSDCHALCVLALQGVVPRLAFCLHACLFQRGMPSP